jgi:hypothetical protein
MRPLCKKKKPKTTTPIDSSADSNFLEGSRNYAAAKSPADPAKENRQCKISNK